MTRKDLLRLVLLKHIGNTPGVACTYQGSLVFQYCAEDSIANVVRRVLQTRLRREYRSFLNDAFLGNHTFRQSCPFGYDLACLSLGELFGCSAGVLIYLNNSSAAKVLDELSYRYALSRREKKIVSRVCGDIQPWLSPLSQNADLLTSVLKRDITEAITAYREDAFAHTLSSYKDFVSSFSHEALSPIQQIRTSLELTLRDVQLQGETRERLAGSLQALDTLRVSLEGMRLLFKDQEKPLSNQFRSSDLRDIVLRWIEIYEPQFKAKNVDVFMEPSGVKWLAHVIPEYVEVMVRNLVSNAAKYSFDASGRESPGKFVVRFDSGTGQLQFVSFGVPIPEEELASIFDFENLLAATADDRGRVGKGVGLYLVAHIARLHQGRCDASSRIVNPGNDNEYARNDFVVTFPRKLGRK